MKAKIIVIICLGCFFYACHKNNEQSTNNNSTSCCNVTNPLNDLPWIQQVIAGRDCKLYTGTILYSCNYNNECVFYFANNPSNVGSCTDVVYNCQGIKMFDSALMDSTWNNFKKNASNFKVVWTK